MRIEFFVQSGLKDFLATVFWETRVLFFFCCVFLWANKDQRLTKILKKWFQERQKTV